MMMTKVYIAPFMEIQQFASFDILTTSGKSDVPSGGVVDEDATDNAPARSGVPANPIKLQPNALEH